MFWFDICIFGGFCAAKTHLARGARSSEVVKTQLSKKIKNETLPEAQRTQTIDSVT